MHILITGNMGYVGPVLVQQIRHHLPNTKITGFDNGYFAPCLTNQPAVMPETQLDHQIFGDVRQFESEHLKDVDAVIYLAAISNDPMGNLYEKATDEINHLCTLEIARLAKQAGVKNFVFASSCSVYGLAEDSSRTENSKVNPLTPYARSKVQSERELAAMADSDFRITCLRFATACGPSPRLRLDLVLNDFVTDALVNGTISILSDGSPWRPLIDVRDMGTALVWASAFRNEGPNFDIFNAGSNEWNFQVKDLAHTVGSVLGNTTVSINQDAAPDKRSYQVDFSKFAAAAGSFAPQRSLEDTISAVRDLLLHCHFQESDFRESDWIRLCYLRQLVQTKHLDSELKWI